MGVVLLVLVGGVCKPLKLNIFCPVFCPQGPWMAAQRYLEWRHRDLKLRWDYPFNCTNIWRIRRVIAVLCLSDFNRLSIKCLKGCLQKYNSLYFSLQFCSKKLFDRFLFQSLNLCGFAATVQIILRVFDSCHIPLFLLQRVDIVTKLPDIWVQSFKS